MPEWCVCKLGRHTSVVYQLYDNDFGEGEERMVSVERSSVAQTFPPFVDELGVPTALERSEVSYSIS